MKSESSLICEIVFILVVLFETFTGICMTILYFDRTALVSSTSAFFPSLLATFCVQKIYCKLSVIVINQYKGSE